MLPFKPVSELTFRHLIFPLSLVLFEFAVYIAHDMIQPGILNVTTEFGVGPEWVSASLSAYLAGGVVLQWLLGPLSDKYGRRPVMLGGVVFFMLVCALTQWSQTIEQFIALRLLQGMSLCFIGAVGYAAIQEAFSETLSVRIMALMANIGLLAPLIGPLAGAMFLNFTGWRNMFWLFAIISAIAWFGLWKTMPETAGDKKTSISLKSLAKLYSGLAKDKLIICGSVAIGMVFIPVLAWIALSPVILIHDAGLSRTDYALLQLPIFLAMIAGNIALVKIADRFPIEQPLKFGAWPILTGLSLATLCTLLDNQHYLWMIAGLSIYSFGAGMVNAGLYRLTLFSSNAGKGSVSAMLGMLSILAFAVGIEIDKQGYLFGGNQIFSLINLTFGLLWFMLVKIFLRERQRRSKVYPS